MQLTIQFFSRLKEIAGRSEMTIELPPNTTIGDLLAHLYRTFPELEKWNSSLLVGVGVDFVPRDHVLQPEDRIALMPPVQGG